MSNSATDFEEALNLTGYGRFHYLLGVCCAICLLATGLQNGLNAYVLPSAQCDLDLSSTQMGSLNASFLIGGISSAFIWGILADLLGRRKLLIFALLADWFITVCAALSQTYLTLMIFRFLNGFLIGGPGTLIYSYFSEFQPERIRTKSICLIGMFFTVAWLLLPALAWVIIPLKWNFQIFSFHFSSWRIFILTLSLPSLISGVWMLHLPESPKFLLIRGEQRQALYILKYMYAINTGESAENFQIKTLTEGTIIKQVLNNTNSSIKTVGRGRTQRLIKDAKDQIKLLFKPPLLLTTFLGSVLLFTNMFGYLGLGLWIPEILNRFQEFNTLYPDEKITLCELDTFKKNATDWKLVTTISPTNLTELIGQELQRENINRCANDLDATVFVNTFIMGAACLVGNLISVYLAGILNRKVLPIATMIIGTLCAVSINWLNTSTQHLIVGSLFQSSMATANIVLNVVIVDIFPTTVNAMAVCTSTLAGRLGAVVSNLVLGFLLDKSCETPIIVIVIVLTIGVITAMFIPSKNEEPTKPKEGVVNESYRSYSDISVISKF